MLLQQLTSSVEGHEPILWPSAHLIQAQPGSTEAAESSLQQVSGEMPAVATELPDLAPARAPKTGGGRATGLWCDDPKRSSAGGLSATCLKV